MSNPSVLLASSSVQVAISLSGRPPDFQSDWLALQSLGALRVPDLEANQSMGENAAAQDERNLSDGPVVNQDSGRKVTFKDMVMGDMSLNTSKHGHTLDTCGGTKVNHSLSSRQPRREDSALLLFMGHGCVDVVAAQLKDVVINAVQDSEEVLDSLLPTLDVVRNRSSDPTSAKGTHRFNPKSSLRQGNKLGKKGVKKWSDLEIVAPSAPTSLGEAEGFGVSTLEERIGHQGSMAERVISIDERGSDGGEVLKEVPTQIRVSGKVEP
ncbi:hypothetical protein V6N13_143332 [Hibiscus sabdariffa]